MTPLPGGLKGVEGGKRKKAGKKRRPAGGATGQRASHGRYERCEITGASTATRKPKRVVFCDITAFHPCDIAASSLA